MPIPADLFIQKKYKSKRKIYEINSMYIRVLQKKKKKVLTVRSKSKLLVVSTKRD